LYKNKITTSGKLVLIMPENGTIVYKAATEEIDKGEAEKPNCDILDIKSGKYICLTINDYMNDIQGIHRSFKKLLSHSELDPDGYYIEWYFNDGDVKCMIRLRE
jgi:predicted transcriptional regulator YdeE